MSQAQALLSRAPHAGRPALPVLGEMSLTLARVHELCGPARRLLALNVAAAVQGPVVWITPGWGTERLNGEGICPWIDPGRLLMVHPQRAEDLLWCMEEGLRTGAVPLVVAELPEPPGLTPVRRLHLAAETGAAEGRVMPLGLILSPGDGGAQGVESRWCLAPTVPTSGAGRSWRLERRRARSAPPAAWPIGVEAQGPRHRLTPRPVTKSSAPKTARPVPGAQAAPSQQA